MDWDDYATTKNVDNSISYEFSTNKHSVLSLTREEDKKQAKNSIKKLYSFIKVHVNVAEDGTLDFQILQYYGNKKDVKKVNLHNLDAFDGSVYYRDLEGKLSKVEVYKNGVVVDRVDYLSNKEDIKLKEAPIGENTGPVPVDILVYIDYYNYGWDSDGNFFMYLVGSIYQYTYSILVPYLATSPSLYHEHELDPRIAHGSGAGHEPDEDAHAEEIILDPSFANTKADCIYEKLNTLSESFKEKIQKFDGEFPVAHLKYSTVSNISNSNSNEIIAAQTLVPVNYVIEIQFNQQYLNQSFSDITFARTFAHEILHAEIYRKLLSLTKTPNYELDSEDIEQMRNNFPGLFDYYTRYFYDEWEQAHYNGVIDEKTRNYFNKIGIDWQHELIGAHYVDTMAQILFEFTDGIYTLDSANYLH